MFPHDKNPCFFFRPFFSPLLSLLGAGRGRNQRRHPNRQTAASSPHPRLPPAGRARVPFAGRRLVPAPTSHRFSRRLNRAFRVVPRVPFARAAVSRSRTSGPDRFAAERVLLRGRGRRYRAFRRVGVERGRGPRWPSMAERRSIYREPGKPRRPPRSHGTFSISQGGCSSATKTTCQGGGNFSVPLWEKKFCTDACAIPWGKLCETKRLMSLYKNVVDWEDSAALEAFNDAKARFCAVYHGQHCDIPLPDPDMFIDIVNPDEYVDPELVADLEKSRRRAPRKDNGIPDVWDSFIFSDKPVPVTGWGDTETSNTAGQQLSVNWDSHLEQPVEENCKQISGNWDCYVEQPAQTNVQQSSGNWDLFEEQPGQTSSWREETNPCITNWNMGDGYQDTWKHDSGWGSAATQTHPWESHQDSYEVPNSQGVSYGHWTHWRRRNNEPGRNSNNRERGGPISAKPMKSKYQADEHSGTNNGWRHCRVRNDMHCYSCEQAGYAKQSLAM